MPVRRRLPVALAAALVTLIFVAAGCGNDEAKRANAYVDAVNTAQTDFARTINRLNGRVSATSTPREDRTTLRGYTEAIDDVVAELRAIDPPESVARLHERLIDDLGAYGTQVRRAGASVRSEDAGDLLDAQQDLLDATDTVGKQINRTIGAINRTLGS